jgi:hypothetical protein
MTHWKIGGFLASISPIFLIARRKDSSRAQGVEGKTAQSRTALCPRVKISGHNAGHVTRDGSEIALRCTDAGSLRWCGSRRAV